MSNLTKEKTGKFKAWSFAKHFLKLTEQTFAFTWKNTLFNLPKSENCFIEVLVYQSFKIKEFDLSVNKQSLLPWKIEKFNWKFRINFCKMGILKISKTNNPLEKFHRFVKLSSYKSFFPKINRKSIYLKCVG